MIEAERNQPATSELVDRFVQEGVMKLPSTALAIVFLSGTFFWAQGASGSSGESSQDLANCYNLQDLTLPGGNNPQDSP